MKKSVFIFGFVMLWAIFCPLIATLIFSKNEPEADNKASSQLSSAESNIFTDEEDISSSREKISVRELLTAIKMEEFKEKYSQETLKALSVIIRSRIFCTDEELNANAVFEIDIPSYIYSTEGIIMTYNGEVIDPPYHNSSYKLTVTSPTEDYLLSAETPEKPEDIKSIVSYSSEEFRKILESLCQNGVFEGEDLITHIEKDEFNRCKYINTENAAISATAFAEKLNLPSLCFQIVEKENTVDIISYGDGDGLGLSIAGAEIMAKEGKTYTEILNHYYSDIVLAQAEKIDN